MLRFIALTIASLALPSFAQAKPIEHDVSAADEKIAFDALERKLFDPYSAKIWYDTKVERYGTFSICGRVNSKNRMGAYVGQHRFVVVFDADGPTVVLE